MWNLKKKKIQTNLFPNINRNTDIENKLRVTEGERRVGGREKLRGWD